MSDVNCCECRSLRNVPPFVWAMQPPRGRLLWLDDTFISNSGRLPSEAHHFLRNRRQSTTTQPVMPFFETSTSRAPLAPSQLSPADFAQLSIWLCNPVTPTNPRTVSCEWGSSKHQCSGRLDMTKPSSNTFWHLKHEHPDVHFRTDDYHNMACKWKDCGMRADFRHAAQAEDWIHRHILEHSGARAAIEGRTMYRCALCKRVIDLYKGSCVEHMRKCITETLFLVSAGDLRGYGVAVRSCDSKGEWTEVYVRATGEHAVWRRDSTGRWVNPLTGLITDLQGGDMDGIAAVFGNALHVR
ncbi:hypothetical protein PENSPDRAFT_654041 [Peniophora sp. CONT]|nr:hypothetical protein PENSPDRAFT_654041 [Peniophora sp. CONT]